MSCAAFTAGPAPASRSATSSRRLAQLGDIAPEEGCDQAVRERADTSCTEGKLVQVIHPRHERPGEAAHVHSEHVRDSLVATERRTRAEAAVVVGLRPPFERLHKPAR